MRIDFYALLMIGFNYLTFMSAEGNHIPVINSGKAALMDKHAIQSISEPLVPTFKGTLVDLETDVSTSSKKEHHGILIERNKGHHGIQTGNKKGGHSSGRSGGRGRGRGGHRNGNSGKSTKKPVRSSARSINSPDRKGFLKLAGVYWIRLIVLLF